MSENSNHVNQMEHKRPTQCDRILQYVRDFGSITQYEAIRELGVMRLASRVSELKKQGYEIKTKMDKAKNRYGEDCYFKRYYIN